MLGTVEVDGGEEKYFAMDLTSPRLTRVKGGPDKEDNEMNEAFEKSFPSNEEVNYDYLLCVPGPEFVCTLQFLHVLSQPFYYRQDCHLQVTAVYHPEDEKELISDLKRGIVSAMSHHIVPEQEQAPYEVLEQRLTGDATSSGL